MISHFGKFIMVLLTAIIAAVLGLYPFIASFLPNWLSFLQLSVTGLQYAAVIIGIILIVFAAMFLDDTFMWSFIVLGAITALPAIGAVLAGFGILAFMANIIPPIVFQLLLILNSVGFLVAIFHGTD